MSRLRKIRARTLLAAGFLLGSFLLLSCQPAQPAVTPKPAEKTTGTPAATAKPTEKAAATPVKGGTLRSYLNADISTLDPHAATLQHPDFGIYDPLIGPDKDVNPIKEGLFKDWTVSGDGKTITFKLQEGVKFHDGTDFDAAAVKFNIERLKDPATKSPYTFNYRFVDSVDVVNPLTIRFNLTQPDPILLARMTFQGSHMVSPAAVRKYGQDFPRNPVGSGPFQFVEWVPGDHITLKRFDGYWGKDKAGNKLPYLDQVVYKVFTDASTAVANLRSGQLDLMADTVGFPVEQLPVLRGDPNLALLVRQGGSNIAGFYLNTTKAPFDKKALRQAVALAVDREGMASRLGEGATAWSSLFHPMNWGNDGKSGAYAGRDLAKAKAKMAEAGYPSGGLKVKLTARTDQVSQGDAAILKANLAEIGVEAEIEILGQAAWLTNVATIPPVGGDYQISTGPTGAGLGDTGHIFSLQFHSKGTRNTFGPYNNPKVDELLDKAGAIYDQNQRAVFYQEAAKLIADDVPFLSTYVLNFMVGMNKKVQNYVRYADGADRFKEVWLAQ